MLTRIRSFLAPPVITGDEEKTHQAQYLSFIIWTIFISTSLFCLIWIIFVPQYTSRLIYAAPLFPLAGTTHFLLKRRNIESTSWIIVGGLWLTLLFAAVFNGGIQALAVSGFTVVVLSAGLLLGRKAALFLAGLTILVMLGLVVAESRGLIIGEQFMTPLAMWSAHTTYLILASVVLHMATSNIQEALARSRMEIEERKRTEVALREAELRYRSLVEQLPVVTYRTSPTLETAPHYVSPQIEKLTGYSPLKWMDDPHFWQELLHPDDLKTVIGGVAADLLQEADSAHEYRLRTIDGRWVWVRDEARVIKDENGKTLFIQGTLSDISEQKRTEEALRASEEKFIKAFYFSPVPMSISHPQRGYLDVNEAFTQLLGFRQEEIVGHMARDVGLWLDTEVQQHALETLHKDGQFRDTEVRFRRSNGDIGIGLASATMLDFNGEACALGSIVDITQRKQAEKAIQISEEKFQKAFHSSPIAMTISSRTRGYLDINDAFIRIIGYSREETLGRFSADIGLWLNDKKHKEALEIIHQEGDLREFEIEYRKKSGEVGTALASAVMVDFEQEKCILASFVDITDRKLNEEALRASEEKFQKAFLSSPVSMMINSPSRGILNVNHAFEELTGYERVEVLERHAFEVGLWVEARERQESIERVRKKGTLNEFEFKFRKKNGEERVGLLSVDLVDIENEKCYLASFQDITSRKEAENTLRNINVELEKRVQRRTAQLEAANLELESFSYSVSHDLRTPLRAINGFARLLVEDYQNQLPPEAQRLLTLVQENALKMGRLIDDLLAFSRLGRSPLKKRTIRPAELVLEVWHDLAHERVNRAIEITIHDLPPCQADPALFRQVLANLLGNAIKFTRLREVALIDVGNRVMDGQSVYYVKDNGAGFEMEYADKLFGVFQRLHHEDEFEGTGVGLATVQRIIHRHGGHIWAESQPNQGATFYFTLPTLPQE